MKSEHFDLRGAVLYGPLGLVDLCAEKVFPVVKEEVENLRQQIPAARFIGQMATQQVEHQIKTRCQQHQDYLRSAIQFGDSVMTQFGGGRSSNPGQETRGSGHADVSEPTQKAAASPIATRVEAIEGYDNLSASQIVGLLDGLSEQELSEVEIYESSHRRRRTILNRIHQLRVR
jgi:hypothetical protein